MNQSSLLAEFGDPITRVESALIALKEGRGVLLLDDEDRENEGDIIYSVEHLTNEQMALMIRECSGIVCLCLTDAQADKLELPPMVVNNNSANQTAFTVSIEAKQGVTTGVSAADRVTTIKTAANPNAKPDDLARPGHVFPLRARPGGVLQRAGHTEAAVDLAVLAGRPPTAVLCEILNEDGSMARVPELIKYKEAFGLKLISIKQLIEYRHSREKLVDRIVSQPFKNAFGDWTLHLFRSLTDHRIHFALTMGELDDSPILVRVQSENALTDVFSAQTPGNSRPVDAALERIAREGKGVFVYMTHACAGLQIPQSMGTDTDSCQIEPVSMDFRGYGLGAQILYALGLRQIRLLSSSHRRHVALDGYGLHIESFVSLED